MKKGVLAVAVSAACLCGMLQGPCADASAADTVDTHDAGQVATASSTTGSLSGKWTYKKVSVKGKKVKKKAAFRYSDKTYPSGIVTIGKASYYFKNSKGRLSTSKKPQRVVKRHGKTYVVGPDGKLLTGWRLTGSKLRYFGGKDCSALCCKTVDGIRLGPDGTAITNLNAALKTTCIKTLDRITDRSASKKKQLRDAWNYVTSSKFKYTSWSMAHLKKSKSWAKAYAYEMLNTKNGECYGFAACFAALAYEIGYKPKICLCDIWFTSPDAAAGHGCVTINGRWFDPEGQHRGKNNTGVYNKKKHTRRHIVSPTFKYFHKYDGSGKPKGVTNAKLDTRTPYQIDRRGSYYYGYKDGSKISGYYVINRTLYHFDSKGRQSVKAFKKLQAATKRDAPWSSLQKLIGKPLKKTKSTNPSCFGEGYDIAYSYKRFTVNVFEPYSGPKVVESVIAA